MARRDPFERAAKRIVKRLGRPVKLVTQNGVTVPLVGVFNRPEKDVVTKGKRGQLTLKAGVPTLTVVSEDCPALHQDIRVFIDNSEFYPVPSQSFDDGAGCMVIVLADAVPDSNFEDEQADGGKWR
ncbi:head-tail joining protein [Enterovibrio norvegicus]|uniref:head-tail joining protein n=1 Tax=Enterovibrio norvegicus TaxID=188144 RepID=UPI000C8272BE|nr:hypothetical protein [Enterovibrio norvegicus]PMN73160.1 hypothetical protein BCT27_12510 [Enterovibrio norvegicus]